ncbi:peptidoglycan DD-metalloendopeptidase family protein (plasmid) [Bacillus sp. 31A1R]|uniref:Peptidoglycan DD-metalloendopeptidase family protein n=1 Tax=Robertmurraya mangrovi TaxID=3098077 RepID=A0ABU5IVJ0_9BACI|nr:peptidoglycan DD-metalloendopeptidase family protein [Bacillus sp. 31A1R]MDZ5471161.1 peptidoglycan DD-metalloendopeptidase family protein [Bacillus sp. 31A1R]
MRDYIRCIMIASMFAICVSVLFLGGKHSQAATNIKDATDHWIWPADGIITDTFGTRQGNHKGIDIAGDYGTPIYTVDDGVVTKSYYSYSYGHVVFVRHNNHMETVYAHLKSRNVKEGQKVSQGHLVGEMGSTGDSSGVHLHFEVHQSEWTLNKENAINPVLALNEVKIGEVVTVFKSIKDSDVLAANGKMDTAEVEELLQKGHVHEGVNLGTDIEANETSNKDIEEQKVIHIVKYGESLWTIAKKYETTVDDILSTNKINGELIQPNQKIIIPNQEQYVVKSGDTLSSIAAKSNMTVNQIKTHNELTSDTIKPEQVLILQK